MTKCQDIGVVNLCSGRPVSVRRLVDEWILENNCTISLSLGKYPYSEFEPMAFLGDTKKMNEVIQDNI